MLNPLLDILRHFNYNRKMPKVSAISKNTPDVYRDLVNTIRQEITKTQNELQKQKAVCYWKIGRHIAKHLLNNKGRSGYNERLYPRLSHDLKIDVRTLQQTVSFHRAFPIPSARSELNWTNYRDLLKISDLSARDALFEEVKTKRITTRELQSQIKHIKRQRPQSNVTLEVNKGTLYTYRTDTPVFIKPAKGRSIVDVGFGLLREVPSRIIEGLAAGTVVESRIENEGYVLVESLRTTSDLYTYRAYLDYVIDGDTVVLYVDLGFNTYSRQKLRLRGIDTPEIATPEGKKAKTFVEEKLKKPKIITIKTYRKDKYDRYLADIFVGNKEIFLNQQLLDEKLAVVY
ncbi:MAG TPA: DUF1016 family protein [Nitrospirae bacterium]|nr:DUF1016 family protein [Nitrospirota bacterium]